MRTLNIATLLVLTGCFELPETHDVMGNYEVVYADNLRVYINDELVAEALSGEDATVEYNGETFQLSQVCSDEGVQCPSETSWSLVAVDQPLGTDNALLNFVNLDPERGVAGQRLGGLMDEAGNFNMLSGLALGANEACLALGVGIVSGSFEPENRDIDVGTIAYGWAAGCVLGDVEIGASLRIETDYTAIRTGDYDVSSVTPEAPIDEEGEPVDVEEAAAEEDTGVGAG